MKNQTNENYTRLLRDLLKEFKGEKDPFLAMLKWMMKLSIPKLRKGGYVQKQYKF